jgi:four helix bundle protein
MQPVSTFRNLEAWNRAIDLVVLLYQVSDGFPRHELYGLVSQLRRAAVSIPANIAEGNSRFSTAAYLNHVNVALGSLGELRALIEVASRLGFVADADQPRICGQLDEVGRLVGGLRSALKRRLSGVPDP